MSVGLLSKNEGSYYTPPDTADRILDMVGYSYSHDIIGKTVMDPSAGDGAILTRAALRLAETLRNTDMTDEEKTQVVVDSIYAIELNPQEAEKCRINVSRILNDNGINVSLDELVNIVCGDTTALYRDYIGKMDFIVGNPPYIRIHNLADKPDSAYIEGMCDIYYAFYDYGQQMLKDDGILSFISPSSWFSSSSGKAMREDLRKRRAVHAVYDYGHHQVFAPYATTYTAITVITKIPNDEIDIVSDGKKRLQDDCWINGAFFPSAPDWLPQAMTATGDIIVRNGYATNLDRVYFTDKPRGFGSLERPAIKASTCEKHYMLYPYDNGTLLALDDVAKKSKEAYSLIISKEKELRARNKVDQKQWWQFARTQGISDTETKRVAMQNIVKPGNIVRTCTVEPGWGVYGGIYVIGLDKEQLDSYLDDDFISYVAALRHYKSGGYYSIGGKEVEHYLNWKHAQQH